MSLPIPTRDPLFRVPDVSAEAWDDPKGEEDGALLATGAWDEPAEAKPETARRVHVHHHKD